MMPVRLSVPSVYCCSSVQQVAAVGPAISITAAAAALQQQSRAARQSAAKASSVMLLADVGR